MAGTISEEDIQKVREASDLVAIIGERTPVKQRGRDFWCCCPLHNEKTPSFKIDPVLQLWHCFGCNEGGDVFGFLMKTEDLSFPEAVRKLAERAHIDIADTGGRGGVPSSKKARLKAVCEATAAFYHTQLMRNPDADAAAARSYLAGRGLGGDVPRRWRLGFAPGRGQLVRHLSAQGFSAEEMVEANVAMKDRGGKLRDRFFNRVMFPIGDAQGECIAFGGRVIGKGEPKYLNSQETSVFHKSQVLYGLDHAKAAMAATGVAVVVEGYTDVIALHEAGIGNAVATLGTALTMRHIRLLARHAQHKIVYLFDGDEAGQRAADRALGFIDDSMTPEAGRAKVELAAVTLPDNLDPAEFVGARGADALRELIARAQPLLKYGIERRLAAHDLGSAEGRSRSLHSAWRHLGGTDDMVYSSKEKGVAMSPFVWLGVAAVMGVVEIVSLSLITMWFVVGALVAFAASLLGADLVVQLVVFLVVSVACLVGLRPVFVKYRDRGKQEEPTHVGQTAVVVEDVDNDGMTGRVETDNRMTWAARSADGLPIPAGEVVRIVSQESVKLIVERKR
ncbi:DNA primase [Gordonibacter urolithinfaciens]|nr:DNA primase [Gordonibacter urolithinfaciens]ROT89843.1 DNA primase [Gordonibacter urolithinfaciens]